MVPLEASDQHPAFDALMRGAFNQDWKDEWSSVDELLTEALDDFPATRRALLTELLEIRQRCSEADVVDLLESMGSGFRPEVDAQVSALGRVDRLVRRISTHDADACTADPAAGRRTADKDDCFGSPSLQESGRS